LKESVLPNNMNLTTKYLLLFLIALSNQASANGWEKVATSENDDAIFYIAPNSIKRVGSHRVVWEVINHHEGGQDRFKSVKVEQEYDCKSLRARILYGTAHSEHFAKGNTLLVLPATPTSWKIFDKGSVADIVRNRVCS
jgi:hypothetical protein